jgi:two-component system chemotaxis sensor kinase CheA
MELDHALLMQTFFAEAEEQLTAMEEGMVGIEHRPDDQELLAQVFRAAHTLKGNSAVVGLNAIAEHANHVEDALESLRNGEKSVTAELVTSVLHALDAIRLALNTALASESSEQQGELTQDRGTSLRIDSGKLDRMLSLSGEISIARGRLRTQLLAAGVAGTQALESHVEAERLYRELQDEIMRARLVPLGPIFRQYQRVVRDLAIEHGKRAELAIEGEDVEIDTTLGEHIRGPIMHMLRNAIDHGIEAPERREALGKNPVGRITLSATREASHIVVTIVDDGAGFSRSRIAKRAELSFDNARTLSDDALFEHVFEPGFSTAAEVTSLSGRGVGMDVVKRNIEALRGSVAIASTESAGSSITLRLPLTLAIIEGFFVEVGTEQFVIPLENVTECQTLGFEERAHADGLGVLSFRGKPLPFLRLRDLFSLGTAHESDREHVAIVRCGEHHAGIAVDALLGQDQAVIKPLGRVFRGVPGVAGSTIGGNGRVALILDVPALVALAQSQSDRHKELI